MSVSRYECRETRRLKIHDKARSHQSSSGAVDDEMDQSDCKACQFHIDNEVHPFDHLISSNSSCLSERVEVHIRSEESGTEFGVLLSISKAIQRSLIDMEMGQ